MSSGHYLIRTEKYLASVLASKKAHLRRDSVQAYETRDEVLGAENNSSGRKITTKKDTGRKKRSNGSKSR